MKFVQEIKFAQEKLPVLIVTGSAYVFHPLMKQMTFVTVVSVEGNAPANKQEYFKETALIAVLC